MSRSQFSAQATPVRRFSHEQEAVTLNRLIVQPHHAVLTLSDLHLHVRSVQAASPNRHGVSSIAHTALARLLGQHRQTNAIPTLLVLNGDIFDFLRTVATPESNEDVERWARALTSLGVEIHARTLQESIRRDERKFGLGTDDYKTVWKLLLIAKAHDAFFRALADWLGNGGSVIFLSGNHDLELYWPLVRQAVRHELHSRGASLATVHEQVAFTHESLSLRNLHLEHGHNYDRMTVVKGTVTLPRSPGQINLPLGSFANRYFINQLERLEPDLENIKPLGQALLVLLRRHPLAMMRAYLRAHRFLWKALRSRRFNAAVLAVLVGLLIPPLAVVAASSWLLLARDVVHSKDPVLATTAVVLASPAITFVLPYLLSTVTKLRRALGRQPTDPLLEGARRVLARLLDANPSFTRVYAVMGHCHRRIIAPLALPGCEGVYINTGTWTQTAREGNSNEGRTYGYARFEWRDGEYLHAEHFAGTAQALCAVSADSN